MNNNLIGFYDSIIDFLCIDYGVFEYTFEGGLDGFEKLRWFFFDGHPYTIPKVFILSSFLTMFYLSLKNINLYSMLHYTQHMSQVIDVHYKNAVNVYEDNCLFFLQSSYEEWVMNCLNTAFAFQLYSLPIRIVDLGCGNGCFVNKFVSHITPMNNIEECIGVDPYMEWLNVASTQCNITKTICKNANDFSTMSPQEMNYSHLSMKEMVHHVDNAILPSVFCGIYKQINNNGRVVIITRPVETSYPFFDRIHHFWKLTQTPYENIVLSMKEAGFDVSVEIATFPVTLQKREWLSFIKNKTWSVFSMCSEQEMNDGLSMLHTELEDSITFNETLIFIVGHKNIIEG